MVEVLRIVPPLPSTERGAFCSISVDKPGERLLYCSGTNVVWRSIAGLSAASEKPEDIFVWKGHTKKTTCASMSPNSQWVVSGDVTGAIRLWGAKGENAQKNEYKLWDGTVKDVGWSNDSGRIVAAGDGKETRAVALIWDTGSKTGEISGHTKQVNSIAFRSERPFRIATGSEDMQVSFFQGPPFKFVRSHGNHSNFVNCVRYSPDSQWFVSAGSDSKLCLYEGKDGELVKEFAKPAGIAGSLWAVAWSPDSSRCVTAGGDKKIRSWCRESGAQLSEATVGAAALPDMQVGVAWPTSEVVVSICLDGRILLWSVATDGTLKLSGAVDGTQGPLTCLSCDKKTGTFLYGGTEGALAVSAPDMPTKKAVVGKGIQHVLTHSESYSGKPEAWVISLDDNVRRLSLESLEVLGTVEVKEFAVGAGWFDAAESKIIIASSKNNIHCVSDSGIAWSKTAAVPRRPTAVATLPGSPCLLAVAVEKPDGFVGGVAKSEFDIHFFEINGDSADSVAEKAVLQKHLSEVCALRFSPSGEMLASGDGLGKIMIWTLKGDAPAVTISSWGSHTARISTLDWLRGGRKLVSGSLDQRLFVWDLDTPDKKTEIKDAHKGGVAAVSACGDDGTFVSAGHDGFVVVRKLS